MAGAWDVLLASNCGRNCGQDSVREGRSGRCSSDSENRRAEEAALQPPVLSAPSSRPILGKTEPQSGFGRASRSSESKKRSSPSESHCFFEQQGGGPQPGGTTRTFRRVQVSAPLAGDLKGLEPRSLEGKQGCR